MRTWMKTALIIGSMTAAALAQDAAPAVPPPTPAARAEEERARAAEQALIERAVRERLDLVRPAPAPAHVDWVFEAKLEKVTWLGVNTANIPPVLREQLKLPRGVGLLVTGSEPKGPADQAGLKPNDVLHKLDDQLITNLAQLSVLITNRKPGDEVSLTILREARPQTVKAKLIEKEIKQGGVPMAGIAWEAAALPVAGGGAGDVMVFRNDNVAGAPMLQRTRILVGDVNGNMTTQWADEQHNITVERQGDKVNRLIVKDRANDKLIFDGNPDKAAELAPELKDKIKKAQDAAAVPQFNFAVAPAFGGARGKVMTWQGEEQIFFLRMMGRTPTYLLALSRKDGRILFDGATMTDEQRKSLPAEVAEQFEMIVSKPEMAKEFGAAEK